MRLGKKKKKKLIYNGGEMNMKVAIMFIFLFVSFWSSLLTLS